MDLTEGRPGLAEQDALLSVVWAILARSRADLFTHPQPPPHLLAALELDDLVRLARVGEGATYLLDGRGAADLCWLYLSRPGRVVLGLDGRFSFFGHSYHVLQAWPALHNIYIIQPASSNVGRRATCLWSRPTRGTRWVKPRLHAASRLTL